jgi:adenine-specific DNA-methyltransferase
MIKEAKIYQAFYTKSTPIVDYMVKSLSLKQGDKIFEPCGGDGVFIDAIVENNQEVNIDIYELNVDAYNTLTSKFSHSAESMIRLLLTPLTEHGKTTIKETN